MLKKTHRLAKTTHVKAALKSGRGFFNPEISLKIMRKNSGLPRFTVVVSTKVDKRAVVRNRKKRILREFIRLNIAKFSLGDYVIMLKPLASKVPEKQLIANFKLALIKWGLFKGDLS